MNHIFFVLDTIHDLQNRGPMTPDTKAALQDFFIKYEEIFKRQKIYKHTRIKKLLKSNDTDKLFSEFLADIKKIKAAFLYRMLKSHKDTSLKILYPRIEIPYILATLRISLVRDSGSSFEENPYNNPDNVSLHERTRVIESHTISNIFDPAPSTYQDPFIFRFPELNIKTMHKYPADIFPSMTENHEIHLLYTHNEISFKFCNYIMRTGVTVDPQQPTASFNTPFNLQATIKDKGYQIYQQEWVFIMTVSLNDRTLPKARRLLGHPLDEKTGKPVEDFEIFKRCCPGLPHTFIKCQLNRKSEQYSHLMNYIFQTTIPKIHNTSVTKIDVNAVSIGFLNSNDDTSAKVMHQSANVNSRIFLVIKEREQVFSKLRHGRSILSYQIMKDAVKLGISLKILDKTYERLAQAPARSAADKATFLKHVEELLQLNSNTNRQEDVLFAQTIKRDYGYDLKRKGDNAQIKEIKLINGVITKKEQVNSARLAISTGDILCFVNAIMHNVPCIYIGNAFASYIVLDPISMSQWIDYLQLTKTKEFVKLDYKPLVHAMSIFAQFIINNKDVFIEHFKSLNASFKHILRSQNHSYVEHTVSYYDVLVTNLAVLLRKFNTNNKNYVTPMSTNTVISKSKLSGVLMQVYWTFMAHRYVLNQNTSKSGIQPHKDNSRWFETMNNNNSPSDYREALVNVYKLLSIFCDQMSILEDPATKQASGMTLPEFLYYIQTLYGRELKFNNSHNNLIN